MATTLLPDTLWELLELFLPATKAGPKDNPPEQKDMPGSSRAALAGRGSDGQGHYASETKNGEGRIVYLNNLAQQALSASPRKSKTDRPCLLRRLCHPRECFADVPSGVPCGEYFGLPLPRLAADDGELDEDSGSGHSHRRAHSGHKDLRMAAGYQHLSPAFLLDAVRLLDTTFTGSSQTLEGPENGKGSCSIVPTASPTERAIEIGL